MFIILSPAKTLDYVSQTGKYNETIPQLIDNAELLIQGLRKKSEADIAKLMDISDKLAKINVERYKSFKAPFNKKNARAAIFAFKGDVYQGMDVSNYGHKELEFAQKHLRILSGLYGLLRPLDLMQPYRLEMGTDFKNIRGKNLYEFWGDKITDKLNEEMTEQKDKLLVNLASNEYFKAVREKKLACKLLHVHFKEKQDDQYKIIGLFAKKARGRMANFIIKNKLKKESELLDFSLDGYKFNKKLSDDSMYVFTRNKA